MGQPDWSHNKPGFSSVYTEINFPLCTQGVETDVFNVDGAGELVLGRIKSSSGNIQTTDVLYLYVDGAVLFGSSIAVWLADMGSFGYGLADVIAAAAGSINLWFKPGIPFTNNLTITYKPIGGGGNVILTSVWGVGLLP